MANSDRKLAPRLWGVHAQQPKWLKVVLGCLPFVLLLVGYLWAANIRHAENPDDKLLPSITQMAETMSPMIFEENRRSGTYIFWMIVWRVCSASLWVLA